MDSARLASEFPILVVKNRTAVSQQVQYQNGDSVQVPPNARVSISSEGLSQVPSMTIIELVSPTLIELHNAGILKLHEVE